MKINGNYTSKFYEYFTDYDTKICQRLSTFDALEIVKPIFVAITFRLTQTWNGIAFKRSIDTSNISISYCI